MKRLAVRGAFRELHDVVDLGPQDVQVSRKVLAEVARELRPSTQIEALLDTIFDGLIARRTAQKQFYSIFGMADYASLDVDDDRATYKVDLNHPSSGLPEFDVVTNFGTTEHVFNIGEAFRTLHNLTRPGGISLHAIPSFAFINHGFYNIHPNALVEMARANDYEILDFSYVDNTFCRNELLGKRGIDSLDFDALPIRLLDMENSQIFMTKVVDTFYRNLMAPETRALLEDLGTLPGNENPPLYPGPRFHICFVFDLLFFAMRRPSERRAFVMPMQNPSGVDPLIQPAASTKAGLLTYLGQIKKAMRRRLYAFGQR
ncbi:MAG: hypothetical protein ABI612_03335 [Betaproteobacteria bacterium]